MCSGPLGCGDCSSSLWGTAPLITQAQGGHRPQPSLLHPCHQSGSGGGVPALLTLPGVAEVVLMSQMVDTSLRLSTCMKSGVSGMSDRESTEDEKMEALERSSRHEGS